MLAVGVSYVEALRSGQWHFRAGHAPSSRPPLEPIHLTPDQCRSYFQMLQADRDRTEAFFAHRPMLRVDFEDLTIDPSAELTRIQAFLGVRFPLRAPAFKKQATRPLRDRIANYAELEAAFADTPWAVFFQTSEFPPDSSAYSRT
jgi:LPS sulfotransferase NodH